MTPVSVTSLFAPHQVVMVDQWAVNPLLDDAQQSVPQTVRLAIVSNGQPPTMFESGDLPPFTASGADPRTLNSLPWRVRHAAAVETSYLGLLNMVEDYRHDASIDIPTPGQRAYIGRFHDWLGGRWTNPDFAGVDPAQKAEAEGDLYDAMFGQADAARAEKLAAVNAASQAFNDARNWRTNGIGRAQR